MNKMKREQGIEKAILDRVICPCEVILEPERNEKKEGFPRERKQ